MHGRGSKATHDLVFSGMFGHRNHCVVQLFVWLFKHGRGSKATRDLAFSRMFSHSNNFRQMEVFFYVFSCIVVVVRIMPYHGLV